MDSQTVLRVVQIKVTLSATLEKLSAISEIQQGLESDDAGLAEMLMILKLHCEYSISEVQAILGLCCQIVSLPPPYTPNTPDERLNQFYELQTRLVRLTRLIENLEDTIKGLKAESNGGIKEMEELHWRSLDVVTEIDGLQATGNILVNVVRERVLEQTTSASFR